MISASIFELPGKSFCLFTVGELLLMQGLVAEEKWVVLRKQRSVRSNGLFALWNEVTCDPTLYPAILSESENVVKIFTVYASAYAYLLD